jgi:hypothetical protein
VFVFLINKMAHLHHVFVYMIWMFRLWNLAFMEIIKHDHKSHYMNHKFKFDLKIFFKFKMQNNIFSQYFYFKKSDIKIFRNKYAFLRAHPFSSLHNAGACCVCVRAWMCTYVCVGGVIKYVSSLLLSSN